MSNPSPHSLHFQLLELTHTISQSTGTSMFDMFKQDIEEVMMVINFFIEKSQDKLNASNKRNTIRNNEKRVRVNDKTASGDWW